jgi:hypothetical protein
MAASVGALGSLRDLRERFPDVDDIVSSPEDLRDWDYYVTIATVEYAAVLLSQKAPKDEVPELMDQVVRALRDWQTTNHSDRDPVADLQACWQFSDEHFETHKDDQKFVPFDSLGLWVLTQMCERILVGDEVLLARAVGGLVHCGFLTWWDV